MQTIQADAFYFVSDFHIVGEGANEDFECEAEFLGFLAHLADQPAACLVIHGDFFDFWQSEYAPAETMDRIVRKFPAIFDTLKRVSGYHRVVYLPGNHDRAAAYDQGVQDRLTAYGIEILTGDAFYAEVKGHGVRIHVEHGHGGDPYNLYLHEPHPAERPFGEHMMRHFINPLKGVEIRPGESWLREIDNVNPLAAMPWWLLSKYFYCEANWSIKALAVPAALLFGFTKIGLVLLAANYLGVDFGALGLPAVPKPIMYLLLGFLGIDAFVLVLLVLLWVLRRDALHTLKRWGFDGLDEILRHRAERAARRAKAALAESRADLYVFGHTHAEFLAPLQEKQAWANTGTWMKRMHRVRPWLYLPPVFVPSFLLTYIRVTSSSAGVTAELRARQKAFTPDLTFLERLAILFRRRPRPLTEADTLLTSLPLSRENP